MRKLEIGFVPLNEPRLPKIKRQGEKNQLKSHIKCWHSKDCNILDITGVNEIIWVFFLFFTQMWECKFGANIWKGNILPYSLKVSSHWQIKPKGGEHRELGECRKGACINRDFNTMQNNCFFKFSSNKWQMGPVKAKSWIKAYHHSCTNLPKLAF